MEDLKKQYRDLELRIMRELRDKVESSKHNSKHVDSKSIKVNVFGVNIFGYTELVIVDDRLTFLDNNGGHYSLFADCDLEDLIDILNTCQ